MSWTELVTLVASLPADSAFWSWQRNKPVPPLEGAAIDDYFATVI